MSKLWGKVRRGPASGLLERSAIAFAASSCVVGSASLLRPSGTCPELSAGATRHEPVNVTELPVFHVVEEPGGIRHMTECEVPTEEYYNSARAANLAAKHPHCSAGLLERLNALEPSLDASIIS